MPPRTTSAKQLAQLVFVLVEVSSNWRAAYIETWEFSRLASLPIGASRYPKPEGAAEPPQNHLGHLKVTRPNGHCSVLILATLKDLASMLIKYALETPDQIANFLALRGCVKRFDDAKFVEKSMQELLNGLFFAGQSPSAVLRPFALSTAGHILLGTARIHAAECEQLRKAITRQRGPFDALLSSPWAAPPDCLVEDEIHYLASDPYSALISRTHSTGGHGTAELLMPPQKIDAILRACEYRPLRQKEASLPDLPPNRSTETKKYQPSDHVRDDISIDANELGTDTIEFLENPPLSPTGELLESPPRRRPNANAHIPVIHLSNPVLETRAIPAVAAASPASSELAELNLNSMQLVLDSETFPNGAPGEMDAEALLMVQRRPATYREDVDPQARDYDNSGADYDFSFESRAFPGLDAATSEPPAVDHGLSLNADSLEIDISTESSSQTSLGPDDARMSLLPTSPPKANANAATNDLHPGSVNGPYDLNFPWPADEPDANIYDELSQGSSPVRRSQQEAIPEAAAESDNVGGDLVVWDPRRPASPLPLSMPNEDGILRNEATAPPHSSSSVYSFSSLSHSARRLPALVLGVDFDIPPPPRFATDAPSDLTTSSSRSVSAFEEPEEDDEATQVPGRHATYRKLDSTWAYKSRAVIDENISENVLTDTAALFQLERVLDWDRLVHPPEPPLALRPDSPLPTAEELPDVELRLLRNLMVTAGLAPPGTSDALNEAEESLALQYEDAAIMTPKKLETPQDVALHEPSEARQDAALREPFEAPQDISSHEVSKASQVNFPNDAEDNPGMGEREFRSLLEEIRNSPLRLPNENTAVPAPLKVVETNAEESFEIVETSELRGMPCPSSLSSEISSMPAPSRYEGVAGYEDVLSPLQQADPADEDILPDFNSSPPSLPLLVDSMADASLPLPPNSFGNSVISNDSGDPGGQTEEAGGDIVQDSAETRGGDVRVERPETPRYEREGSMQRHAWQRVFNAIPETPEPLMSLEDQLRVNIRPSPFWNIHQRDLKAFLQTGLESTKHSQRVSFVELCERAPWRTDTAEDFNLDSDLFHTLLSAASRRLIRLEQDTASAGSDLFIARTNVLNVNWMRSSNDSSSTSSNGSGSGSGSGSGDHDEKVGPGRGQ